MFLKKAPKTAFSDDAATKEVVTNLLKKVEEGREAAVSELCKDFDKYEGDVLYSKEAWDKAIEGVPEQVRRDIDACHANVKAFAEAQLASIHEFETELSPGVFAGQRVLPVETAGCYVPGGRYAHIASCVMTVTTARVAGVKNVVVCSPPRPGGGGCEPAIMYTARKCGADSVLCCGGVQGVAALRHGLFTNCPANILVGPGNKFVAEAKRMLFGDVGIDMVAGPTETMVIADDTADPEMVATDIVSQAEHGVNSPCWVITTSDRIANAVAEAIPRLAALLPAEARAVAEAAWRDYGEIYVAKDRDDAARQSDIYASEHLHIQCEDLDWWLKNLKNYGSLFLGEETCVTYGDKCSGPNHVLPTKGVAKYSGGLNVHKFLKLVTYQRMSREANRELGSVAARISRTEGMEGHARAADARLAKYFPDVARSESGLLAAAGAKEIAHTDAWAKDAPAA